MRFLNSCYRAAKQLKEQGVKYHTNQRDFRCSSVFFLCCPQDRVLLSQLSVVCISRTKWKDSTLLHYQQVLLHMYRVFLVICAVVHLISMKNKRWNISRIGQTIEVHRHFLGAASVLFIQNWSKRGNPLGVLETMNSVSIRPCSWWEHSICSKFYSDIQLKLAIILIASKRYSNIRESSPSLEVSSELPSSMPCSWHTRPKQ